MTLSELETTIRSHRTSNNVFDVVLVTSAACTHCANVKQSFSTLTAGETNFYHIEFDDLPTLFALPDVPSIAIFNRGVKLYEAVVSGNIDTQRIISIVDTFKNDGLPGPFLLS